MRAYLQQVRYDVLVESKSNLRKKREMPSSLDGLIAVALYHSGVPIVHRLLHSFCGLASATSVAPSNSRLCMNEKERLQIK